LRLVVAIAAALLGCGNKSSDATSKCSAAAQQGVDAMVKRAHERIAMAPADMRADTEQRTQQLDALAPRLRALIANRCVDDKWSAAVIDCYANVTEMDGLRDCRGKLPAEQQARMQKEELDLFAGALGPAGFGSAAPATSPEVAKLESELRRLNAALADAAKNGRPVDQIQREMQDVNDKLAAARARAANP